MYLNFFRNASSAIPNIPFNTFKGLGRSITWKKTGNGTPYSTISSLTDIDAVARTIYAEICDAGGNNAMEGAFAVAQVIKNRMNYQKKSARSIVTASSQFSCMNDGNKIFGYPASSSYNNYSVWAVSCFLAYNLVSNNINTYHNRIGSRKNFYDKKYGMPFYIYNNSTKKYDRCTKSNITKATHYYGGGKYNKISTSVIMIGGNAFYTY